MMLKDMTPEQRKAAIERARDQLQAELQSSAPEIGRILDEFETDESPKTECCQTSEQVGHFHYQNGSCDLEPPYSMGGPA